MNARPVLAAALAGLLLAGAAQGPRTPVERTGRPARPEEARRFLRALRTLPGWEYRELPLGGEEGVAPLPLAVWPPEGTGTAPGLTVLVMAGQHGDEPSGSDALLALVRDLAVGRHPEWRGRLRLLVLPMVNPWGIAAGVRNNEAGVDLNRDHLRLRAPETRALHRLFGEWSPQVTIDLHEKPEACVHVEWARATHPAEDPLRRAVARMVVEGAARALGRAGVPSHPFFTRSFAPVAGEVPERLTAFYHPALPDPSDSLNGFALLGAVAFFVETAGGPSGGPYREIVAVQHKAAEALIGAALDQAGPLRRASDRYRAVPPQGGVALQMRQAASPMEPAGEFTPCAGEADQRTGVRPWRPRVEVSLRRPRPAAYWVPARFAEAAAVLEAHGARLYAAVRDVEAEGEAARVVGESAPAPEYGAPPLVAVEFTPRSVHIRAGDWVVPVVSPLLDLLPILLEPESQFGLGRYPGLGLSPGRGEEFPIVRLAAMPAPEALEAWPPAGPEKGPAGGRGRRPVE